MISGNVSHSKSKKNKKIVDLALRDVIMCRWHDFAANVDPTSFFVRPKLVDEGTTMCDKSALDGNNHV